MVVLGFLFFLSKGYFKGHGQEGKKYRHLQARKKKEKRKEKNLYALCKFTLDLVCVYALKWRGAPTKNRKCQGHPTACEWNTRGFQPVTILSAESLYAPNTNTHNWRKCWLWDANEFLRIKLVCNSRGKKIYIYVYIHTHHSTAIQMCNYSIQGLTFTCKMQI